MDVKKTHQDKARVPADQVGNEGQTRLPVAQTSLSHENSVALPMVHDGKFSQNPEIRPIPYKKKVFERERTEIRGLPLEIPRPDPSFSWRLRRIQS